MKCPHCGVHYMDNENECPVCGKHPGILTPKKQSKFSNAETSAKPIKPSVGSTKKSTAKITTKTNGKTTQRSTGKTAPPPPGHQYNQKKSGCSTGCLVIVIIAILFVLTVFASMRVYTEDSNIFAEAEVVESEDTYYEACDIADVLPSGTWVSDDGSLTVVIDSDGKIIWSDGIDTAEDFAPIFDRMLYTEDNFSEYCTYAEMENYPLEEYTHYNFYFSDLLSDMREYDLYIYIPNDTAPEELTAFDCYDWDYEEFFTLTRISDSTEPPALNTQST